MNSKNLQGLYENIYKTIFYQKNPLFNNKNLGPKRIRRI